MSAAAMIFVIASACTTAAPQTSPSPGLRHGLFGVTAGTRKAEVHRRLGAIGTLKREEGKRQEVWDLRDPRFSGAIAAYDGEWRVRFITFVAREHGQPVLYSDVLELAAAQHRSAGASHTYTWRPTRGRYVVIARGTDPAVLTYLTLRSTATEREGEEDD